METRTIEQVMVYKLHLNQMTSPKIEHCDLVAISYEKEKLIEWMKDFKAEEGYREGNWYKTFKKDTPLEWYNTPSNLDNCEAEDNLFGHGINSEWIDMEQMDNIKGSYTFID